MENLTDNLKNLTLKEKKELLKTWVNRALDESLYLELCEINGPVALGKKRPTELKLNFCNKRVNDVQKSIQTHIYSHAEYRAMCDDLWIPTIMLTDGSLFVSNAAEYLPKLVELNMKTGKFIEFCTGNSKFFKVL